MKIYRLRLNRQIYRIKIKANEIIYTVDQSTQKQVNVLLTAGFAVYLTRKLNDRLGSMTLILLPIIVGVGACTV